MSHRANRHWTHGLEPQRLVRVNTATTVSRISAYLDQRRRRRRELRSLRYELRSYTARAHIQDLLATLDRFEGPEVNAMRSILNEQALRHQGGRSFIPLTS